MFNCLPGAMLQKGHTHQWKKGFSCSRVPPQHNAWMTASHRLFNPGPPGGRAPTGHIGRVAGATLRIKSRSQFSLFDVASFSFAERRVTVLMPAPLVARVKRAQAFVPTHAGERRSDRPLSREEPAGRMPRPRLPSGPRLRWQTSPDQSQ